jgi:endoglucanase
MPVRKLGTWLALVACATVLIAAFTASSAIAGQSAGAHHRIVGRGRSHSRRRARWHAAFYPQQCPDPYPSVRDSANPLMLATPPGSDPLAGAQFFVDGPRHGPAAGAIAAMLGFDPRRFPVDYSWASFQALISQGAPLARMEADPVLMHKVLLLEKIASGSEANRISIYSGGGGPGAIFGQTQKILCHNLTADPGSIPILSTYFMHPVVGGCPTPAMMTAMHPAFVRRVDEMAEGIANRPAVVLVENDGIGSSSCVQRMGSMPQWEADLRFEALTMEALPHTVVYLEGGYSDSNSPRYTARVLNAAGVRQIRGFWTNDTHSQWTIHEARWGAKVSRLTGGAHFVINTAGNGRGPKLNPHPKWQGVEDLCNAPGRGLGPLPTTDPGLPDVDAFLWTGVPGSSSGHCNGGTDPGHWWMAGALVLAANAQDKLGPGFPNNPY